MNPFEDRLATECMLFYMNYVRSLGFIEFKETDVIMPSVNDARIIVIRLMMHNLSYPRIHRVMRIASHEKKYIHTRYHQIRLGLTEINRAMYRAIVKAPPFQGEPWPTETIMVYRPSKPLE